MTTKRSETIPVHTRDAACTAIDRLRWRIRTVLRQHPTARPVLSEYFSMLAAKLAAPSQEANDPPPRASRGRIPRA
jgi:hypothetical protein